MAFRTQKISQMTPKGADLEATDLIEVSTIESGSYVTRSITGQELIDAIPLPPTGLTVGTTPIASGTIGRVLFQGTGNVLQQSSSLFWDSTNNRLGIGTSTPDTNKFLDILYNVATVGGAGVGIRNSNSTGYTELVFDNNTTPTGFGAFVFGYGGTGSGLPDTAYFFQRRNAPLIFGTNGSTRMQIHGNGNIGINTTTDAGFRLDVNGTARVQGALTTSAGIISNGTVRVTATTASPSGNASFFVFDGAEGTNFAYDYGTSTYRALAYNGSLIRFLTAGTERARFAVTTGNLLINTTTDAGFKLDVNGTARVTGTASFNTGIIIGVGASTSGMIPTGTSGQESLIIRSGLVPSSTGTDIILTNGQGDVAITSGSRTMVSITRGFNPTSGTGVYNFFSIDATINQTGGANGAVRGIYYNPTLTSVLGTHHAFHSTSGRIRFENLPTSATGLSSGDLWNDGGTLKIV